HEGFRDDKPDAVLGRLKIAIERARALGKNERALVCPQKANERLESAAIAAFLVDRNYVQFRQQPAEQRDLEERFACEEIDSAPAADAGKRRIEIALVIHREDDRSFLDDALGMHDAKTEKDPSDQSGKMVDREIPVIHGEIVRPLSFRRPMISPTTPSIVRLELSMTCASSAMMSGEKRREESASSRIVMRSRCPCASRRRRRISGEASM